MEQENLNPTSLRLISRTPSCEDLEEEAQEKVTPAHLQASQTPSESFDDQLKAIVKREAEFFEWFDRRKVLSADEKGALKMRTIAEIVDYWSQAADATKTEVEKTRATGWRKYGNETYGLALGAHDFLQTFQPLVNIVKDVGGPYGALGIGVISLLFTVSFLYNRF